MTEITVEDISGDGGGLVFSVTVSEGGGSSEHRVMLGREYYERLTQGRATPRELVEKSFMFLLEREPKESILGSFDLSVIERYFPEYPEKIGKYF